MTIQSRTIFEAKELLFAWTMRTIRGRYQQSTLGWIWAIIQPASQAAIFSLIFTLIIPIKTDNIPYPVFSYSAIVPWTLLASSLADMTTSLTSNINLVTKIYFPRETIPAAVMLARLMDFFIAMGLLFVLMIIYRVPISIIGLLYLLAILAIQLLLILGLGLVSAALNVFYRDIQSLISLFIQIWFYASPIIYPSSQVPVKLHQIYFLNPMAGILEAYRDVLLRGTTPNPYLLSSAVVAIIIFLMGYCFFKRVEFKFADII